MDQTKNNLDRIRAFDAEEGEWRTINGAHVLIKNGRIAGGAGGALNGQPFRGGSLKKMQSGSKGSKFNENREKASVRWATSSVFGPTPAGLNKKRLDPIPNNVTTEVPHYDPSRRYTIVKGRPDGIGKISDPLKYDVLEGARPIATGSFGTTFEAAHKQLTVPHYAHWASEGSAYMEPSKTELAARARSLKKRRPDLFKAGRTASPAAPQQSAPHATKLGRMQPGSTAVNAGKEAKRLDHNARVYHRTARRAREAYNAKMDKSGGEPNAIEQKKNAYKAKSYENVSRRDQAAASAKGRIAKLRQLAKSLKARNPNAFKG